ncbi:unnamed protein product [Cyprideis torosa]|uniref:Uncharacterized protein n=1 Tax=Cyprideis torosa TaxID=163714 RepID=A0A7R8WIB7_9CRUS|nr:unnamed protein product [Cyprideis torosa]CAG0900534.1 unnamed protein product [Cyprideis torosa]
MDRIFYEPGDTPALASNHITIELDDTTAQSIVNGLITTLGEWGFTLDFLKANLVAVTIDGASVMVGNVNRVLQRLKDMISPEIITAGGENETETHTEGLESSENARRQMNWFQPEVSTSPLSNQFGREPQEITELNSMIIRSYGGTQTATHSKRGTFEPGIRNFFRCSHCSGSKTDHVIHQQLEGTTGLVTLLPSVPALGELRENPVQQASAFVALGEDIRGFHMYETGDSDAPPVTDYN